MFYHNQLQVRKFLAPEIIFGTDSRLLASRYIHHFGVKKILLVTDPGIMNFSWFRSIETSLKDEGFQVDLFYDISANPKKEEVSRGAEFYLDRGSQLILAVGGGSPMDCAKAIGIVSSNNAPITDFEGVDQVSIPIPPLMCIPSTAGTAADVSQFSIISETEKKYKMAIISKSIVPDISFSDPVPLTTMDSYLSACTGIDALVHGVEAYVSNASSTLTDSLALDAIYLVKNNLLASIDDPENLERRNAMMTASMKAGLAFSNASLGAVHAMAHSLGGLLDLPHGECNSLLLPYCMEFNFSAAPQRFREIAKAMDFDLDGSEENQCLQLCNEVKNFVRSAGIGGTLKGRGVKNEQIQSLSEAAINDACMATNPREVTMEDIQQLYEDCLG